MRNCLMLGVLVLVGCKGLADPTTALVGVEAAFGSAVAVEVVWLGSGKATPAQAGMVERYRMAVDGALAPLAQRAGQGNPPSNDEVLAAQLALNAFQAYLTSQNIGGK